MSSFADERDHGAARVASRARAGAGHAAARRAQVRAAVHPVPVDAVGRRNGRGRSQLELRQQQQQQQLQQQQQQLQQPQQQQQQRSRRVGRSAAEQGGEKAPPHVQTRGLPQLHRAQRALLSPRGACGRWLSQPRVVRPWAVDAPAWSALVCVT
ncbi:hypothetical protein ON010_g10846 [Phytophthora cinnamomi]|nr:hypothetical protein ON010_g10846 [Phytophthora cinnamomi]